MNEKELAAWKVWLGEAYDEASQTLRVKAGAMIKVAGEDADELTLCEPLLGQVEEAFKKPPGIERDRILIAYVGKTTPQSLTRMPVTEYNKAMSFLNFFTGAGPATGENASAS